MALTDFVGTWKLVRSENFEEFLEAMGVNFMVRKIASKSSPTLKVELVNDHTLKFVMETGPMKREGKSDVSGEEYEQENSGTKSTVTAKFEDGKIVESWIMKDSKVKNQVVTRELIDGEMVQTLNVGDGAVICKRIFKKT